MEKNKKNKLPKLVKSVKNESYYANLSALFLNISVCLGLFGIVAGSIIKVCYGLVINESLSTIYIIVSVIFFAISIVAFSHCYKKYHKYELANLKKMIDTSKTTDNRDIYVLGTMVMIIIELTTIYFIMINLNNKCEKITESRDLIKEELTKSLNGTITADYSENYKELHVRFEDVNSSGTANVNILDEKPNLCNKTTFTYIADLTRYDSNTLIDDFNNFVKAIFNTYPATIDIDTFTNGMNSNIRSAIEGFNTNSLDYSYDYNRSFALSYSSVERNVKCLKNGDFIIITVTYTCS